MVTGQRNFQAYTDAYSIDVASRPTDAAAEKNKKAQLTQREARDSLGI